MATAPLTPKAALEAMKARLAAQEINKQAGELVKQKRERNRLKESEITEIERYIANPVEVGYWRLSMTRPPMGKLLSYFATSNDVPITEIAPRTLAAPKRLNEDAKVITLRRITTIFRALTAALVFKKHGEVSGRLLQEHGFDEEKLYDGSSVLTQMPEAVRLFEEDLYFPDYLPTVTPGQIIRLKRGYVVLVGGWGDVKAMFVSTDREPLDDLAKVLSAVEVISAFSVERIFSPEEELFEPYFSLLQTVYDEVVKDSKIKPGLQSAFDYYQKEDFVHCISSLGLVAEAYLTQVFEYYLRIACSKHFTLGQIYDNLHSHIREITAPPTAELKDLDPLYAAVKELIALSWNDEEYKKKSERLIRDVLNISKSDRKYYFQKIESISRPLRRISVFPGHIQENLQELMLNRNAAAHKTRIPIGSFEALRTLYCLTTFVLWWNATRAITDWAKPRVEILSDAVALSIT
jgi:hypothetical protein